MLCDRLREFGIAKFGSMKGLAFALDMRPQSLQQYINGSSQPGAELLKKLLKLGCDINWLLTDQQEGQIKEPIVLYGTTNAEIDYWKGEALKLREIIKQVNLLINTGGQNESETPTS